MSRFDNAVGVVTGAGNGIGAETARTLARQGARVALFDIDDEAVSGVVKEIAESGGAAVGRHVDVSSEADWAAGVRATEDAFGAPVTLLHSNAALTGATALGAGIDPTELPFDTWQRVLTVNAGGSGLLACKHVVPSMLDAGGGSIVLTSSVTALVGKPDMVSYAASKGALISFSRAIAATYGDRAIRCNVVAPGPVETAATANIDPGLKASLVRNSMIPRFAETSDIANAVAFLLSGEASLITGQILTVDGGLTMRYPTANG